METTKTNHKALLALWFVWSGSIFVESENSPTNGKIKKEEGEGKMTYDKSFKEEAVRLSDEIGVKKASEQLGVPYYTKI